MRPVIGYPPPKLLPIVMMSGRTLSCWAAKTPDADVRKVIYVPDKLLSVVLAGK